MEKETRNVYEESAAEAVEAAAQANAVPDKMVYTHTFKEPFTYQGTAIEQLTFDWGALRGTDHLAIENELLLRGKTLIAPEFTGDFLVGMAVRACTDRCGDGRRVLTQEVMKALPLRDFQTICKRARDFLLRAGL